MLIIFRTNKFLQVTELNNILSNHKLNFSKCENKLKEYEKQIHEYKLRDEILNKEIEEQKVRNNVSKIRDFDSNLKLKLTL